VPTLSNIPIFGRFVNTAGITVEWAVNSKVSLTASYDHTDLITTSSEFRFADFHQDQLSFRGQLALSDTMSVGVESAGTSTRYSSGDRADALTTHAGLFFEALVTPYTRLRIAGGYQELSFDGDESNREIEFLGFDRDGRRFVTVRDSDRRRDDDGDDGTYYLNFLATNQLSRYYLHSLRVSKETQLGITSDRVDLFSIRYNATWRVNSAFSLQGSLLYDHGSEEGGLREESFRRWGASLATTLRLSRKLDVSLGYEFLQRDSNLEFGSYYRNLVFAELHYAF
jgi:hypothetical protein